MESHLLLLSDGLIQGMCFTIFVHVLTFGFCNCNLQTTVLQSLSPHFAVVPGVPHPPAVLQCVGGTPPLNGMYCILPGHSDFTSRGHKASPHLLISLKCALKRGV